MRGQLISGSVAPLFAVRADRPLFVFLMIMAGITLIVGLNIWLALGAMPYG